MKQVYKLQYKDSKGNSRELIPATLALALAMYHANPSKYKIIKDTL